ncbi:hypothetical protein P8452_56310 [Trifolium repens]|nr:hypothetical protein P8452_56310 [Trifolium repens]
MKNKFEGYSVEEQSYSAEHESVEALICRQRTIPPPSKNTRLSLNPSFVEEPQLLRHFPSFSRFRETSQDFEVKKVEWINSEAATKLVDHISK